jgi:hypothetical protein
MSCGGMGATCFVVPSDPGQWADARLFPAFPWIIGEVFFATGQMARVERVAMPRI